MESHKNIIMYKSLKSNKNSCYRAVLVGGVEGSMPLCVWRGWGGHGQFTSTGPGP